MAPELSNRGQRYAPIPQGGQVGIDFEPTELFDTREMAARTHQYPYEDRFWMGINFGRDLLNKRAKTEYREPLSISLTYLFVKGVNDLLAAVSVSKRGYSFQSWPLIRGGVEAAELMDYLCRHPEDTEKWINKERRFDSLSWLRDRLPGSGLRGSFYNIVNDLTHANLRPIDAYSTLRISPDRTAGGWTPARLDESGTRYLIVGPNPYPMEGPNPIEFASMVISYPIRVLWQSDPGVVDSNWVTRFQSFDAKVEYIFGEAWNHTD